MRIPLKNHFAIMKSLTLVFFTLLAFLTFSSCRNTVNTGAIETTKDSIVKIQLRETPVGKSNYLISIPENYTVTENEGPDFYVYYINTTDSTDTVSFTAGMYFGNHPTKFKPANDSCRTEVLNGTVLESNTDWTVYNCNDSYSLQAIADSKSGEGWNALVHAFGNTHSDSDILQVIDIFATLRKKK